MQKSSRGVQKVCDASDFEQLDGSGFRMVACCGKEAGESIL